MPDPSRLSWSLAALLLAAACRPSEAGPPAPGPVCTMEAKVCPDGSLVGRTGPNCEFALCPGEIATPGPVCTREARICLDGTAVGRTGPNCEFAPCPGGY